MLTASLAQQVPLRAAMNHAGTAPASTTDATPVDANVSDATSAMAMVPLVPAEPMAAPVPEPSTLLLVGTGLVGVALTARRRRRRADKSSS